MKPVRRPGDIAAARNERRDDMTKRMLIDSTHPEETRVVLVDGNKVDEFDFESVNKRQISGNIYLAKVTRVEPSLQAAFVDYGGNRHGFLSFAEIHPDYYQIPVADREALLEEERARESDDSVEEAMQVVEPADGEAGAAAGDAAPEPQSAAARDDMIERVDEDDVAEDVRPRKPRPRRYKIQEVIKVRQILLVQVVKEERGTKGAALTTYLSLPGRYCVLMPNTARGGGISRKITNAADRKRLKAVAAELPVPQGAGLIIRTAGAKRTKAEIKRDYDYLIRLWDQIRDLTLKSIAPAPIYEEGNLIKRAIRDYYTREIEEVLVEGAEGYRIAKDFMKMIMPSHARHVKQYSDPLPLFARYQVESYLASMFNPRVELRSGGYLIIGVTEALVAIDVNSGKSTREGSIEQTAYATNLEAAEEVARQLRLRDLAGLIVIDFIDMDEKKHNAAVEKRLKEKLKTDRARIQVGRISGFGLMEMSRQRLRPGMVEATTQPCPHCHGTGLIRSDESLALSILRQIEEEAMRGRAGEIALTAPVAVINFLINNKRAHLASIEARYDLVVRLQADAALTSPEFRLERIRSVTRESSAAPVISLDGSDEGAASGEPAPQQQDASEEGGEQKPKKRRRRRKRKKSGGESQAEAAGESAQEGTDAPAGEPAQAGARPAAEEAGENGQAAVADREPAVEAGGAEAPAKPRRSRSGRSRRKPAAGTSPEAATGASGPAGTAGEEAEGGASPGGRTSAPAAADAPAASDAPAAADTQAARSVAAGGNGAEAGAASGETPGAPAHETHSEPGTAARPEAEQAAPAATGGDDDATSAEHGSRRRRRGWWALGR